MNSKHCECKKTLWKTKKPKKKTKHRKKEEALFVLQTLWTLFLKIIFLTFLRRFKRFNDGILLFTGKHWQGSNQDESLESRLQPPFLFSASPAFLLSSSTRVFLLQRGPGIRHSFSRVKSLIGGYYLLSMAGTPPEPGTLDSSLETSQSPV